MSAIINALFGTYPEGEQQSAVSSECLHTSAIADDVQVKSVISSETQVNAAINTKLNIDGLLAQLNTTYAQVDQYSQARTAEINEQVQKSIAFVLENTQHQQEELLADANRLHLIIDNDYKSQLQKAVEVLDGVKAKALADLEHDLQGKQQLILNEAKKQIDLLNDQANAAKLNVLVQAQEQAKENIDNLANQVVAIGQQETENLLQSTTTTIITSQAQAAETNVTVPVTEITNEQQVTSTTDNQSQVAVSR
jgi:hypothetical protein